MRIFIAFEDVRLPLDVQPGQTVGDVKTVIKEHFKLNSSHVENKILQLTYAGAVLNDAWVCSDIGITSGSTVKSALKDSDKPMLHIDCPFNEEFVVIRDQLDPAETLVSTLRSKVSIKTGLPVSVFRLCTASGKEMFDVHTLEKYGVRLGDTLQLHVWDGWSSLLVAATQGHTKKVLRNASSDEQIARYQFRVACYIAAHFGHVDLANSLLNSKYGAVKPEEPVGQHPGKLWSKASAHIDTWKCPVHEAAECGKLNVLKIFVQNNICCLISKDGRGHNPIQVSLRHGQSECVTYLTSKLYSSHTENNITLPVAVVIKARKWCERARERVLLNYGVYSSSIKRRPYKPAASIGHGVIVDGFGDSPLQSRAKLSELMYLSQMSYGGGLPLAAMPKTRRMRHRGFARNSSQTFAKDSARSNTHGRELKPSTSSNSITAFQRSRFATLSSAAFSRRLRYSSKEDTSIDDDDNTDSGSYMRTPVPQTSRHLPSIAQDKKSQQQARRSKMIEGAISLPAVSVENTLRPFFHVSSKVQNPVVLTLQTFEKYRGFGSRDSAIQCMIVASTFKDKAWLRQVDMAISLAKRNVFNCLSKSDVFDQDVPRSLPKVASSPIKSKVC